MRSLQVKIVLIPVYVYGVRDVTFLTKHTLTLDVSWCMDTGGKCVATRGRGRNSSIASTYILFYMYLKLTTAWCEPKQVMQTNRIKYGILTPACKDVNLIRAIIPSFTHYVQNLHNIARGN